MTDSFAKKKTRQIAFNGKATDYKHVCMNLIIRSEYLSEYSSNGLRRDLLLKIS